MGLCYIFSVGMPGPHSKDHQMAELPPRTNRRTDEDEYEQRRDIASEVMKRRPIMNSNGEIVMMDPRQIRRPIMHNGEIVIMDPRQIRRLAYEAKQLLGLRLQ